MNPALPVEQLRERLDQLVARMSEACAKAALAPDRVALLAVSKTFEAQAVLQAWQLGLRHFGENYVQEGVQKRLEVEQALGAQGEDLGLHRPIWHLIGPLQSNKTQVVAGHFDWVHSVDRLKIAQRLAEQRPEGLEPLQICLQVNLSGEASKSGVSPEDVIPLAMEVARIAEEHGTIALRGLMTIPEPSEDAQLIRARFQALRALKRAINAELSRSIDLIEPTPLDVLSMGMSADLEQAIAASDPDGVTWIRVGSALFGARTPTNPTENQQS
jgi:pyridoxal phosphate enzyme (YggS family)